MRARWLAALLLAACAPRPEAGSVVRLELLGPVTAGELARSGARIAATEEELASGRIWVARCATAAESVSISYVRVPPGAAPGAAVEAEAGDPAYRAGARVGRVLRPLEGQAPVFTVRTRPVIRCAAG
ncbi:MAG: hypothetical protein MUC64_07620 [Rubritepida sp.]|jgi:hypothetical protein|nr:hypothetical protein [Rubritepida sp.]